MVRRALTALRTLKTQVKRHADIWRLKRRAVWLSLDGILVFPVVIFSVLVFARKVPRGVVPPRQHALGSAIEMKASLRYRSSGQRPHTRYNDAFCVAEVEDASGQIVIQRSRYGVMPKIDTALVHTHKAILFAPVPLCACLLLYVVKIMYLSRDGIRRDRSRGGSRWHRRHNFVIDTAACVI